MPDPRTAEFAAGSTGAGGSAYPATSLAMPAAQADPAFAPSGPLQIPNMIKTANAMSSQTYMATMLPYASKSSPMSKAQIEEGSQQ
jgi:hypothetical protein